MRRALLAALLFSGCAATPEVGPVDELSQADVKRTIGANLEALKTCVRQQLRRAPEEHGKAMVQFHILPSGETADIQVRGDAPPELASCVREIFSAMRFREHRSDPEPVLWPLKY